MDLRHDAVVPLDDLVCRVPDIPRQRDALLFDFAQKAGELRLSCALAMQSADGSLLVIVRPRNVVSAVLWPAGTIGS